MTEPRTGSGTQPDPRRPGTSARLWRGVVHAVRDPEMPRHFSHIGDRDRAVEAIHARRGGRPPAAHLSEMGLATGSPASDMTGHGTAPIPSPRRGMRDWGMDAFTKAASLLAHSERILALTGAGLSTASGIPDFRGPQGRWTQDPDAEKISTLSYYLTDEDVRRKAWRARAHSAHWEAAPNAGHLALVDLERAGKLAGIVTQNTDGLHLVAGSSTRHRPRGARQRADLALRGLRRHRPDGADARARPGRGRRPALPRPAAASRAPP